MGDIVTRSLGRGRVIPGPTRFRDGTPIPVAVQFHDGTQIRYAVPRDTCDPRYKACVSHQIACDCREAEIAEDLAEYRAESAALRAAIADILVGHPDGCYCTGCQIARQVHLDFFIRAATEGPTQ